MLSSKTAHCRKCHVLAIDNSVVAIVVIRNGTITLIHNLTGIGVFCCPDTVPTMTPFG